MTTTEYLALKKVLVQGGLIERIAFLESFFFGQLCEFAERLDLNYGDRLEVATWRFIARLLAIKGSQYAFKVDGPTPCADINNSDCACTLCEENQDGESNPILAEFNQRRLEAEMETVDVLAVQQKQKAVSVQG